MHARKNPKDTSLQTFFEVSIEKFLSPLDSFVNKQSTSAVLLLLATIIAMLLANSALNDSSQQFFDIETGVAFHNWHFLLSLKEWVGSGLMALFFFLIGLEVKREVLAGKLQHPGLIIVIIMAAVGGMVFPAIIYWVLNHGTSSAHGWAIPMATDTAFAIGVLALLAKKVSYGISVFLITLAIFDDIGAIAIISVFYTNQIVIEAVLFSALILTILVAVNLSGIRQGWVYGILGVCLWLFVYQSGVHATLAGLLMAIVGVCLWLFVYQSGVHATLAGLLMAIVTPARTRLGQTGFVEEVQQLLIIFKQGQGTRENEEPDPRILSSLEQHLLTQDIAIAVKAASTPLQRWENQLTSPIGIFVLPLFALCTAGVSLTHETILSSLNSPVTLGIILGLVIGKPLGIALLTFIGLKLNLGKLPAGMTFNEVVAAGLLAGIGFTMSLFITTLSFEHNPEMIDQAKIGILFASLLAALAAYIWISITKHSGEGE
jgi:NhaA family Na+:H+ antiporter